MNDLGNPVVPIRAEIEDTKTGKRFRIVGIHAASDTVWLYALEGTEWPFEISLEDLRKGILGNHYCFVDQLAPLKPNNGREEGRAWEIHKRRYQIIGPLVNEGNQFAILDRRTRADLIRQRAQEAETSRQTIENLLKAWWNKGMHFDAIAPEYHLCGAPGRKRNLGDRKVGRPRKYSVEVGVNATIEMRRILCIGADFYFNGDRKRQGEADRKRRIKDAYDQMVGRFFTETRKDANGFPRLAIAERCLTLKQFSYHISTNYPNRQRRKAKIGTKQFELRERPMLSKADHDVQGPGDRFEIDATIADVYLVSEFDRSRIVGRPVIYFAVDTFSRLIVGIYVGFEGPSWIGAMMVLTNMVMPKVEFCRGFGIEITEEDWPSHYAPKQILADRAELMSVSLGNNIIQKLGVEIQNTRAGRGDMKGIVERRFGIVQVKFGSFVPGYVRRDFGTRGARDYRLDAALTLREFTQIIIYGVLEHNMLGIDGISLQPGLVTEGKDHTPIDLWNWGVANRSGLLHALTFDQVALEVMPQGKAEVTSRGIKFKSAYYFCDQALKDDWFSLPNRRSSTRVDISYDPRGYETAYLRDERLPHGFVPLSLTEASSHLAGKSLFEREELEHSAKCIRQSAARDQQARRIVLKGKSQEICDAAIARRDSMAEPSSKAERISGIRANRQEEKLAQREAETFRLGQQESGRIQSVNPMKKTESTNGLDDLRKLRQLRDGEVNAED
jgi:hypothetical protein